MNLDLSIFEKSLILSKSLGRVHSSFLDGIQDSLDEKARKIWDPLDLKYLFCNLSDYLTIVLRFVCD
jgi:hypothetical protein